MRTDHESIGISVVKIFGIMLVKNEADVIEHTLEAAKDWADRIFILDNGSDDGTWEIVSRMADHQIVPWKQDFRMYSNALRADVFNAFRSEASDGDWWCYKMDSDEFYVDDPVAFLGAVPRQYHVVFKRSIDYMITREDVAEYGFTGDFATDRAHIRSFVSPAYSEPRFFRYRRRLSWPTDEKSPRHMGVPYPEPITVRHYQWRSPEQMQRRIDARKAIPRDSRGKPFKHVQQNSWEDALAVRSDLQLDDGRCDLRMTPLRSAIPFGGGKNVLRRVLHGIGILP